MASDEWFSDSLPADLSAKDAMSHLAGSWFIELAELSSMKRSEIEATKRFASATQDKYRPPYGRNDIIQPRQCVLVGTTNDERYLKDSTGNRRFWPVAVTKRCDIAALAEECDQLWAEAMARFNNGERWYLSHEEETLAAAEQDARLEVDDWEDPIAEWLDARKHLDFVTGREVATGALLFEMDRDITQIITKRIAGIMRKLGWERGVNRLGTRTVKGYRPKEGPYEEGKL